MMQSTSKAGLQLRLAFVLLPLFSLGAGGLNAHATQADGAKQPIKALYISLADHMDLAVTGGILRAPVDIDAFADTRLGALAIAAALDRRKQGRPGPEAPVHE